MKCRIEAGSEKILAWMCKNCPKREIRHPRPYSVKMHRVRQMIKAGYPFEKNDLTLEEWLDLGRMEYFLESKLQK
ncbi:hypothetical protein [Desulfobacter vibrioformis]|uniref:hypothetical protein n=1 Tax=Desulfobacter vibrioformis TaxID=34031 RepID=UPI000558AB9C|nr:hypothetical protein [Desulfobacter vibrioformis]